MKILYEDKYLLVVNKPAGLIVQGAKEKEESLLYRLKEYLKERDKKEGNPFLAVVHRLDKPVTGALLFAKRSKTAGKLFNIIQEKKFEKVYLAMVEGAFKEDFGMWIDATEEGKRAITFFFLLKHMGRTSLLLLYPFTGRKHQLRKALSFRGYPIVGDIRYGSKIRVDAGRAILLHSLYLRLPHPHREETLEILAYPPHYFGKFSLDKSSILEFLKNVKKEVEGVLTCVRQESG